MSLKRSLLLSIFAIVTIAAFSQTTVSGIVTDEENQPFELVNIISLKGEKVFSGTTSNQDGHFTINVPKSSGQLIFKFIGYQDYLINLDTIDCNKMLLVQMSMDNIRLDNLVVTAQKAQVQSSSGSIVVNIPSKSIIKEESLLDLITKLPEVASRNGKITIGGNGGVIVSIDGRELTFPEEALSSYLSSRNANNVASVKISKNPSSKYDAQGGGGVIEIITNKKRTDEYYLLNASSKLMFSKANINDLEHFSLIYSKNPFVELRLGASHKRLNRDFYQDIENRIIKEGHPLHYVRYSTRDVRRSFYNYNAGMSFIPNKNFEVNIDYEGYYDNFRARGKSKAEYINNKNESINTIYTKITGLEPYSFNSIYGQVKKTFQTVGTFNFDVNYMNYKYNATSDMVFYSMLNEEKSKSETARPLTVQYGMSKIDYSKAISSSLSVGMGVKAEYTATNTDVTDSFTKEHSEYAYDEFNKMAYALLEWKGERDNLELGLRYENYSVTRIFSDFTTPENNSNVKTQKGGLFPTISYNHIFSPNYTVNLSLSKRINKPNYIQLSPISWVSDAYFRLIGNENLEPERFWKFNVNLSLLKKYIFGVSLTYIEDPIYSELIQKENIVYSRPGNFPKSNNYSVFTNIPIQISKAYKAIFSASTAYENTWYALDNKQIQLSSWVTSLSLNQQLNLPWGILTELDLRYSSGHLSGYTKEEPMFYSTIAITKDFLKDKNLSISLYGLDVFDTFRIKSHVVNDIFPFKMNMGMDYQSIGIGIKYVLGGKRNQKGINIDTSRFEL